MLKEKFPIVQDSSLQRHVYPLSTEGETEVLRDYVTCSQSHGKLSTPASYTHAEPFRLYHLPPQATTD